MKKQDVGEKIICYNRKALHNYNIGDTYEAGIVLLGTEVKAIREGKANLKDSYARISDSEIFLHDFHISPYSCGNRANHDPLRVKKLLLHKAEIRKLYGKTNEQGFALIPLKAYFKRGRIKIQLAVAKGKKLHDKRDAIRKKDERRAMEHNFKKTRNSR